MVLKSGFRSNDNLINDSVRSEEMLITNNNIGNSQDNQWYESAISSVGDASASETLKIKKKKIGKSALRIIDTTCQVHSKWSRCIRSIIKSIEFNIKALLVIR